MIRIWHRGNDVYEFDAPTKQEEEKKARVWAKENGWKFSEVARVKEE